MIRPAEETPLDDGPSEDDTRVDTPSDDASQERQARLSQPYPRRMSSQARRARISQMLAGEAGPRMSHHSTHSVAMAVPIERPSRVAVFFDGVAGWQRAGRLGRALLWQLTDACRLCVPLAAVIGEPVRIIISFWQVVSSFSNSLYVPWPNVYYALASSLNVVSLQFLKLPAISCIQPQVSFLTIFNGVTITMLLFIVFCALTYYLGQRSAVAKADPERRRRFKARLR